MSDERSTWERLDTPVYVALIVSVMAVYVYAHVRASMSLPVPWGDESSFLWPARAFAHSNTLFAPQLNVNRTVMWMPPGYAIVMGLIYKVLPFSLDVARWFSCVCMLGVFVVLTRFTGHYRMRYGALIIVSAFLLDQYFVVAGNVARMGAMVLLVVFTGFLLMQRGKVYYGMALVAATPLMHPNGSYFALWGAIWVVAGPWILRSGAFRMPTRREYVALAVCGVAWLCYGAYVALHWESFQLDMAWQFANKLERMHTQGTGGLSMFVLPALAVACLAYCVRFRLESGMLLFAAMPAWMAPELGHEMWYDVYGNIAYLLVSVVMVTIGRDVVSRIVPTIHARRVGVVSAAMIAMVLVWNSQHARIINVRDYPDNLRFSGMRVSRDVQYFSPDGDPGVRNFLRSLRGDGKQVVVDIYPWADALEFSDLISDQLDVATPVMEKAIRARGVEPIRVPDVYVVRVSRLTPKWLDEHRALALQRAEIDTLHAQIAYRRDSTEIWYYRIANPTVHADPVVR